MRTRQKSKDSLGGRIFAAFFGLALFGGSFFLLWFNEGRTNFADVAKKSTSMDASSTTSAADGEFVAANGDLTTDESLDDPSFLIGTDYIQFNRSVEMYAWVETEETVDNGDGTEDVYYDYHTDWTSSPEDSSSFYDTSYANPNMAFSGDTFTVSSAMIGAYKLKSRSLEYPLPDAVNINNESLSSSLPLNAYTTDLGDYIYIGDYTLDDPDVGDLRVSFTGVPQTDNVTLFGTVSGDEIIPHVVGDDETLYRVFFTDRQSASVEMEEEYTFALWGSRIGGFFMMWCGLFLMFFPLTIILTFLPILERFGNFAIGAITFFAAALISTIVIVISFVLHNIWVLVGLICLAVLLVGGAGGGLFMLNKRKEDEA